LRPSGLLRKLRRITMYEARGPNNAMMKARIVGIT
jgi:hypothetical protein